MTEYVYKKFKISYTIKKINHKNLYQADAQVTCALDNKVLANPKLFHTEYDSLTGIELSLRKMIADYIDFEWQESRAFH